MNQSRELTPAFVGVVAQHLREVIAEFKAWGVRINSGSRLPATASLLEEIAAAGEYPSDRPRLSVLGDAIRDAQEFVEIANVLPSTPLEVVRHDLNRAVRGNLEPPTRPGVHYQFQTQLWAAAMMGNRAGSVGVLTFRQTSANPDYVLPNGTLSYAIEVKRPNGALDARNVIRKAARQIRSTAYHGGVIVVDLTDCLPSQLRLRFGNGRPNQRIVNQELDSLIGSLHREIFSDNESMLRSGREQVYSLLAFARTTYWDESDLSIPYLIRSVGTVNYWRKNENTLRGHRARWLGNLLHEGIETAGHRALDQQRELNL